VRICAGYCERELVARGFIGPLPSGTQRVYARERCWSCYYLFYKRGGRRLTLRSADVIEDTAFLAEQGFNREQIADKLGINPPHSGACTAAPGFPVPSREADHDTRTGHHRGDAHHPAARRAG
jgi:hypothetical protein